MVRPAGPLVLGYGIRLACESGDAPRAAVQGQPPTAGCIGPRRITRRAVMGIRRTYMKIGHDTLIGALLIIAGALALGYTVNGSRTWRTLSIIGACVAIIIGVLLIFGLA
jgi:hypothetical protein